MSKADSPDDEGVRNQSHSLVVATRLHLGNASSAPEASKLKQTIAAFADFASTICNAPAVIAVDSTPKIDGYDHVAAVRQACDNLERCPKPYVLPVTPWGKFVPALNALISLAMSEQFKAKLILFVSAETRASRESIQTLCRHVSESDDTLVAGALMSGHQYLGGDGIIDKVALNGRTSPWNTLAVWDLSKLALTGFQLVSEGLLTDEPSYGVEEVFAIALLQNVLGEDCAKAKLVKLSDIEWEQNFEDEERRLWHENKMKSKLDRANRQLELVGLTGSAYHC